MKRAMMNDHVYEKVDGLHYGSAYISSSVTNDMSIKILLVLTIKTARTTNILDVKGELFHREFTENEETIYMDITQGFDK